MREAAAPPDEPAFSLVLGGPFFRLLRWAHLSDDALRRVRRRMAVVVVAAWLPLLLLSAVEGHLLGPGPALTFLRDPEAQVRFLLVVPMLIGAELWVHQRLRPLVEQFRIRGLVPPGGVERFDRALAGALRLRQSVLAEALIVVFVYVVGVLIVWRQYVALDAPSWYASPGAGGERLSIAGVWYVFFSIPLFQFLLYRWYFRLFIWARFLWQVSRIHFDLLATHPDKTGGLGFIGASIWAFVPLAAAQGALLAASIANRILYDGDTLRQFDVVIGVLVLILLCVFVGPLLVFAPQLARVKRQGLREYGSLAQGYVRDFNTKWMRGGAPADEPFLGSGDIQSLADLGNSFSVVEGMRLAPLPRAALLTFVAATLAPITPLLLTIMPLEKLVQSLVGIVL